MRTKRLVLIAILVLTLVFSLVPTVSASSVTHYYVQIKNATIPWLFPPPEGLSSFCFEIPEGVFINPDEGSSKRVKDATIRNLSNGGQQVNITDLVTGTASDQNGNAYRFFYLNNATLEYDGSVVHVRMRDVFTLKGDPVRYSLAFDWAWAYETASLDVSVVKDEGGKKIDISVNPFPFATNDGIHEDPNIVPGSWQQFFTQGDPWNCDPL